MRCGTFSKWNSKRDDMLEVEKFDEEMIFIEINMTQDPDICMQRMKELEKVNDEADMFSIIS